MMVSQTDNPICCPTRYPYLFGDQLRDGIKRLSKGSVHYLWPEGGGGGGGRGRGVN